MKLRTENDDMTLKELMKLKKVLRTLLPVFALSLMSFDSPRAELKCQYCTPASAQNKSKEMIYDDPVQVRVIYNSTTQIMEDVDGKCKYCLDIGKKSTAFYDYAILMNDMLDAYPRYSDEYVSKRAELSKKYGNSGRLLQSMVNIPENGMYTYIDIAGSTMRYEEPIPHIEWQLDDSIKNICEYTCRKAVCRLYGRTWHVWYTEDIPLFYGPYILSGLPGLILAAWEEEHHFEFEAESIENLTDGTVVQPHMRGRLAQKCTRSEFIKLRNTWSSMTAIERTKVAWGNMEGFDASRLKVYDQNGNDIGDKVDEYYFLDKE